MSRKQTTVYSSGAGSVLQHVIAQRRNEPPTLPGGDYQFDFSAFAVLLQRHALSRLQPKLESLDCLRAVDGATLAGINLNVDVTGVSDIFTFGPVVDDSFIVQSSIDALSQGKVNGDILLSVTNTNEGVIFVNQSTEYDVAQYMRNFFPLLGAECCSGGLRVTRFSLGPAIFKCPTYSLLNAFPGKSYKGFLSVAVNLDPNDKLRPSITPAWSPWSSAETEMLFNETEGSAPYMAPFETSTALLERCECVIRLIAFLDSH
ncbi:hypothetical protein K438DRAFT_1986112 [Mycena galopus ATCC 62051]|nr:hypothetical protein K438DRAFT_1986112 [Mycena galopus ATCC 62051]